MKPLLTLGTRGSRLALAQARMTKNALLAAHGWNDDAVAILPITTTGDRIQDRSLIEAGGKGLFTKEIEEALLRGEIDLAVHSAKDLPAKMPAGLELFAALPREDARDCLIGAKLQDIPKSAKFGTSSPRRAAMMKRLRPDLQIVDFRGNVETRLQKIARGDAAASLLALAGLKRIGLENEAAEILSLEDFPPAVGQGIVALESRGEDRRTASLLEVISHAASMTALCCERAFLNRLDGSCRTPIAGYAHLIDGQLHFHGMILSLDGRQIFETRRRGPAAEAAAMGLDAAKELKAAAPPDFFAA